MLSMYFRVTHDVGPNKLSSFSALLVLQEGRFGNCYRTAYGVVEQWVSYEEFILVVEERNKAEARTRYLEFFIAKLEMRLLELKRQLKPNTLLEVILVM